MKIAPPNNICITGSKIKGAGRGVFAAKNLPKGHIIEISPVVLVSELPELDYPLRKSELFHYYFRWGGKSENTVAIGVGYASIYNHSFEPNISYRKKTKEKLIEFYTLRPIKRGEELRMNYNYGDPNDKTPLWIADIPPDKENILPPRFVKTLRIFSAELNKISCPWAITGSTNLAIRGMGIQPKDLDIVTTLDGLEQFKKIYKKYLNGDTKEKSSNSKGMKNYLEQGFKIGTLDINITGEMPGDPYYRALTTSKNFVMLGGTKIPLISLENEWMLYQKTGRKRRSQQIRRYLNAL